MKNPIKTWREFARRQNETLDIDEIEVFLPALPDALEGFRMVVVADLHVRRLNDYHKGILQAIHAANPGCILIAGDTIDSWTEMVNPIQPLFDRLTSIAPVIAVLGNNDCLPSRIHALRDMYHRAGVTILENEMRMFPAGGTALQFTGLLDPTAKKYGIEPEHTETVENPEYVPMSRAIPPKKKDDTKIPSILLVHQPQLVRDYAALHPSLIIAGHAHGGQFRTNGGQGFFAPDQGVLPKFTSGLYTFAETQMIVSRGLGNHNFPLRLNNPPHLPVVILRKENAG